MDQHSKLSKVSSRHGECSITQFCFQHSRHGRLKRQPLGALVQVQEAVAKVPGRRCLVNPLVLCAQLLHSLYHLLGTAPAKNGVREQGDPLRLERLLPLADGVPRRADEKRSKTPTWLAHQNGGKAQAQRSQHKLLGTGTSAVKGPHLSHLISERHLEPCIYGEFFFFSLKKNEGSFFSADQLLYQLCGQLLNVDPVSGLGAIEVPGDCLSHQGAKAEAIHHNVLTELDVACNLGVAEGPLFLAQGERANSVHHRCVILKEHGGLGVPAVLQGEAASDLDVFQDIGRQLAPVDHNACHAVCKVCVCVCRAFL